MNNGNYLFKSQLPQFCYLCNGTLMGRKSGQFVTCNNCGLMIRRSTDGLDILYQVGWQNPLENLNLTGGTTPYLASNYIRELTRSLGFANFESKMILDFGGGRGEMALALAALGAKVIIVDPYSHKKLKESGLAAYESLDQIDELGPFDCAVAIDVFEHLKQPWVELKKIRKILKPGGNLYLSTPNGGGLNARIYREKWRELLNPSHLLIFTSTSLELLLQKAGFERYHRLRWRVYYSDKKLIQAKDLFLMMTRLDGVLRYMAYV